MSDFPCGWTQAVLPDLVASDGVFIDGDWVESKDQDPEGDVRLIQLADVGDGTYRDRSSRFLTSSKAKELGCTFLKPGDVLVARMPDPLGRACIFPGDARKSVTVVDVCVIRPGDGGVNARWLVHTLNAPQARTAMVAFEKGTTRKRISRGNLARILLPVPSAAEQERIVAAIEEQFSRLDAGEAALQRVRLNLKRMRTAMLLAAVTGKLANAISRNWPVVALTDVATIASGQTPRDLCLDSDGPIPFYKVGDMNAAEGFVMARARGYLDEGSAARFGIHIRPAGTVIFPKRGGAIATNKKRLLAVPAAYDLNTMGLIPGQRLHPKFLYLWLSTIDLTSLSDGSNVPQINHGDLAPLQLRLPSLADQSLIITAAEREFSRINGLETALSTALKRAAVFRSSILASAFSGRLVPQDPSDESAPLLLDRIAADRASFNGHRPSRNGTRRTKVTT